MRAGEKAILPLWFRTGLVLALLLTLYFSFSHSSVNTAKTVASPIALQDGGDVLALRNLKFVDLDKGAVSVINADNGEELKRIHKGEDGFLRSVMRGLVRERKAKSIGPEMAFKLVLWQDGLLSLIDPATQRRVELSAFGTDNVAAFSQLLSSDTEAEHALWL